MNRLYFQPAAEAVGQAAQLYIGIKAAVGVVPNAYAGIGSNNPQVLDAVLRFDASLHHSGLAPADIELVKLVVSEQSACDYCLAAHTLLGKKAGLTKETILAARRGLPSGDARIDALANFARLLVSTRGTVPAEALGAIRKAGYNDGQITAFAAVIASITFTNLFNRINDTPLDFPPAD